MTTPRRPTAWFVVVAAAVPLLLAMALAEIALRLIDGYGFGLRLRAPAPAAAPAGSSPAPAPSGGSGKWLEPAAADYYVRQLPVAPRVDRAWFALDPEAPPRRPIDPDLDRRSREHEGFELSSVYEWNEEYVRRAVCGEQRLQMAVFSKVPDLYMYAPPGGDIYPQFRFLRGVRYRSGLQTNAFGWRGPEIAAIKPAGTIRIAFVGASTTIDPHADRFSYPEYVGRWLNEWARATSRSVRFEIVNAGREGIDVKGVAAVVEHELRPVRPDLVVDYEGGNQFWPDGFIKEVLPPRPKASAEEPSGLSRYSALARRIGSALDRLRAGREPQKPSLRVDWPPDLDEQDPPLGDPRLPLTLPTIIDRMNAMRASLAADGGTYLPVSFVWFVKPGLVLDRQRDAGIYSFLNDTFWPFSYAHVRRYADFQNRVFQKYAAANQLPFIDLAAVYPEDARLFFDAVHMTPAGIKLKAWLVLQQLVPEIDRRLAEGRLPVADNRPAAAGQLATAAGPLRLVRIETLRQSCDAKRESKAR